MWICRQWTKRQNEWTSDFDNFATEAEAKEHGDIFVSLKGYEDDAREYEVYECPEYTVYGREITQDDMDNIGSYMDDEIREELHSALSPCEPAVFLKAYLDKDPDFRELLESEFDFKEA